MGKPIVMMPVEVVVDLLGRMDFPWSCAKDFTVPEILRLPLAEWWLEYNKPYDDDGTIEGYLEAFEMEGVKFG